MTIMSPRNKSPHFHFNKELTWDNTLCTFLTPARVCLDGCAPLEEVFWLMQAIFGNSLLLVMLCFVGQTRVRRGQASYLLFGCWQMCMFKSQWQPYSCTLPQDRPLPSFLSPQQMTTRLLVRVPQGFSLVFLGQFLDLGTLPHQVSHPPCNPQVGQGFCQGKVSLGFHTFSLLKKPSSTIILGLVLG